MNEALSRRLLAYTLHPYREIRWWVAEFVPYAPECLQGLATSVYCFRWTYGQVANAIEPCGSLSCTTDNSALAVAVHEHTSRRTVRMVSDEELFLEWQKGSAGALEALVQRHHAPLLAHLSRLTTDRHMAEDLVQETFLRLVREARAYHYPRPFTPWLYTIARNLARNHWNSAYQRRVTNQAQADTAVSSEPDPAEWMERLERRRGVLAAVATLSFEHREVLSLRYGRELSVEETAAVLGLPAGTVKSRAFTALRSLRDRLRQRADDQGLGGIRDQTHG